MTLDSAGIIARENEVRFLLRQGESINQIQKRFMGTEFAMRRQNLIRLADSIYEVDKKQFIRQIKKAPGIRKENKIKIIKVYKTESNKRNRTGAGKMYRGFFGTDGVPIYQPTH